MKRHQIILPALASGFFAFAMTVLPAQAQTGALSRAQSAQPQTRPSTKPDVEAVIIQPDKRTPPSGLIDDTALLDFGAIPSERVIASRPAPADVNYLQDTSTLFNAGGIIDDEEFKAFRALSISELERYLAGQPADASALTVLAVRQYQASDITNSLATLRKTRTVNPQHIRSAEIYSGILIHDEKIQNAIREIRSMLDQIPDNKILRFNLACAFARNEQTEESLYHLIVLAQMNWPELTYHIADPDLDSLWSKPAFTNWQDTLLLQARERVDKSIQSTILLPHL